MSSTGSYSATATSTTAHGLAVGQMVVIAGVGVAGYNGTFTVASVPSPTTFTYAADWEVESGGDPGRARVNAQP